LPPGFSVSGNALAVAELNTDTFLVAVGGQQPGPGLLVLGITCTLSGCSADTTGSYFLSLGGGSGMPPDHAELVGMDDGAILFMTERYCGGACSDEVVARYVPRTGSPTGGQFPVIASFHFHDLDRDVTLAIEDLAASARRGGDGTVEILVAGSVQPLVGTTHYPREIRVAKTVACDPTP
jgi:hypothetical protein